MDNSLLNILFKILENKDVLNIISQIFSKQNLDISNNIKKETKNEINSLNNIPVYPEPLYYPQSKKENENTKFEKQNINNVFDIPSLMSSLSSLNIGDLISKVSPIINIASSLKTKETNKKNTINYGADDIDFENLIRSD